MTHHPRKRFGQHFLNDHGVLMQIVQAVAPGEQDHLIEIGPGQGALTRYLLPRVKHLDIIEIDRDLVAQLRVEFAQAPNLTVYQADVLQAPWELLLSKPKRVTGNLPYNITTPLLFMLFNFGAKISDMNFLLQKEVVDRLTATAGSTHYSRLTVMAQYFAKLTPLFEVGPEAFSPPPKVNSAFIQIIPYPTLPFKALDFNLFTQVVKEAFSYRRKTLANSLRRLVSVEALEKLNIDPHCRPQQITVENFVKISNILTSPSV